MRVESGLRSKLLKGKISYLLFLAPALAVIRSINIYPIIYGLYLSFTRYNLLRSWYGFEFVGLNNYFDILKDPKVWSSIRTTFLFLSISVSIELIFGLGMALLIARDIKGKNVFRGLILVPMIMTPVVVALIWKYMLNATFGVFTLFFRWLGFDMTWYDAPETALPTIILIDIWQFTPFIFIVLLSGLVSLPIEPFESAKIDGASNWKVFLYITLPLLKPVILVATLLRIVDALRVFDKIWVLTRGGPGRATEVYSILVFKEGFQYFNMGYAASLSVIMLVIAMLLSLAFIRISRFEI